ncbi:DinB family protein [Alicyclobacillus herbarius]|uniref:DinB family protein n=1 Tax=Alicyclobacillus herbarius TaxID=122960 RepID=UPI00041826D6|nr:DinB family protein [Alicyclobacillus herbarius]
MEHVEEYRTRIHQLLDEMIAIVTPLSESAVRFQPAPEKWSILEVLAHVEEANTFWMKELAATLARPQRRWGRTLQHESRLGAVAAAPKRRVEDVIEGVRVSQDLVDRVLASVRDADLEIRADHVNPKFGNQPMSFLLDHFLIEHITGHIGQIQRNLAAYDQNHGEGV